MKHLLHALAQAGRAIRGWYDKNIRVDPESLVWPEPPSVRAARVRARAGRRR
jgi:hypothetical protein